MNILHVINSISIGGAENLLIDLVNQMAYSREHNIYIYILSDKSAFNIDKINTSISIIFSKSNSFYSFLNLFELNTICKENKIDVIHSHLSQAQFLCSLYSILFKSKIKLITTEHSTFNRRRRFLFFKFLDAWMYSKYSKVCCISEATQSSLLKWLGKSNNDNYPIIENGININKFLNSSSADDSIFIQNMYKTKLCMIGRMDEAKDFLTLINLMNELNDSYVLFLVGDGKFYDNYKEVVLNKGLENKVFFLGRRPDVSSILKNIDIYIQSSYWEGFGLAALEAMASGCLVVGSNVEGLNSLIYPSYLFDVGDVSKLKNIIINHKQISVDPELQNFKKALFDKYSINMTVDNYLNMYSNE